MKLMSLFDGSGGFPLAGGICGVEPVYASEIEPYPIAVTKSRFPKMKHLGNVANIKGDQIEPVDIITFGSPCQDMSVAGKRAGLKHTAAGDDETTRSGMFMEAIKLELQQRGFSLTPTIASCSVITTISTSSQTLTENALHALTLVIARTVDISRF